MLVPNGVHYREVPLYRNFGSTIWLADVANSWCESVIFARPDFPLWRKVRYGTRSTSISTRSLNANFFLSSTASESVMLNFVGVGITLPYSNYALKKTTQPNSSPSPPLSLQKLELRPDTLPSLLHGHLDMPLIVWCDTSLEGRRAEDFTTTARNKQYQQFTFTWMNR